MNKIYGPFYLGENGVWHWHKDCPDYPKNPNPKVMVSSIYPDTIELCSICSKLDKGIKEKNSN